MTFTVVAVTDVALSVPDTDSEACETVPPTDRSPVVVKLAEVIAPAVVRPPDVKVPERDMLATFILPATDRAPDVVTEPAVMVPVVERDVAERLPVTSN